MRKATTTFIFDSSGRLTSEHDLNGYATSLGYDQGGHLVSITDPAGRVLKLAYSGSHISKITDPINRTVQLNYDAAGNLASYKDVQGNTTSFTYDSNHLMLSMTDPNGGVTSNIYDSQNRVTSQTDPMGRKTTLSYGGDPLSQSGSTTTITDAKGNVSQDVYQFGVRTSVIKGVGTPQAATWQFIYDPNTLGITSAVDPNGNKTTSTFDQLGNLLTSTDPLNRATANTYNQFREVLSSKDGNGITTAFSFDSRGNLLSVSRPLTQSSQVQTTSFQYTDTAHPGDVTAEVDPNGNTWKYAYDKFGNQTSTTDPLGNKSSATFNKIGFKLSSTTPKGNAPDQHSNHEGDSNRDDNNNQDGSNEAGPFTTTFKYNNYGDLLSTTDPLGHIQSSKYDAKRNVIQSTDGNGNVTKNVYDSDNELIQVNRADGTSTKTTYNPDGTVLAQIDGAGNATTYRYDSLARAISSTDPLNRATEYSYDRVGNLLTKVDAKAQTTTYKYDAANQLKSISYSDGVTPNVTNLQYDGDGNRLSITDGTGTSTYAFDSLNRLTSSKDGAGVTVGYSYDLNGNLTGLNYPGSHQVSRTFDKDSRMATVADWLGNAETFSYDQNSNLVATNFPASTGEVDQQAFNNADNLISIVDSKANSQGNSQGKSDNGQKDNGQTLASFFYTRDGNNQVTSESSSPSNGNGQGDGNSSGANSAVSKSYTYTPLNQLQNVNHQSYSYSPADNLVKLINGTTQLFDPANQLISSTAQSGGQDQHGNQNSQSSGHPQTTTFAYDQDGNRASATSGNSSTTYGFDQANRLINFNSQGTYTYNGDGLRMSKTVGSTAQQFTWDIAEGLPLVLSDTNNQYVYGPGGLPIEQISTSGQVDFFHHDQLGSTRLLTSSTGQVAAAFAFDPYGNASPTKDTGQSDATSNSRANHGSKQQVTTPLLFAGQYLDSESGLYYLRARFYDPTTAQFMSLDLKVAATRSPYAYVAGNPLNGSDPSGMCWGPGCWVLDQLHNLGFCDKLVDPNCQSGANDIYNFNSTHTYTVCVSGQTNWAANFNYTRVVGEEGCVVFNANQLGTSWSNYEGTGVSFGLGLSGGFNNASSISQLQGPFTTASGSALLGQEQGYISQGCGPQIIGGQAGINVIGLPGGVTWGTSTTTVFQVLGS